MPQPLSRFGKVNSIIIGNAGDRVISRHPDLAVLAMEALASWNNVEAFLLHLFVELLGGDDSLAASVFMSLSTQSAKSAAINSAAFQVLSGREDELKVLRAILAIAKTHEKARNKLAHWTWGESHSLPDALLLVDPKATVGELDVGKIYVYRAEDFRNIVEANDRLCGYGLSLRHILQGHVANHDGALLRSLLETQEIRERIPRANEESDS